MWDAALSERFPPAVTVDSSMKASAVDEAMRMTSCPPGAVVAASVAVLPLTAENARMCSSELAERLTAPAAWTVGSPSAIDATAEFCRSSNVRAAPTANELLSSNDAVPASERTSSAEDAEIVTSPLAVTVVPARKPASTDASANVTFAEIAISSPEGLPVSERTVLSRESSVAVEAAVSETSCPVRATSWVSAVTVCSRTLPANEPAIVVWFPSTDAPAAATSSGWSVALKLMFPPAAACCTSRM